MSSWQCFPERGKKAQRATPSNGERCKKDKAGEGDVRIFLKVRTALQMKFYEVEI